MEPFYQDIFFKYIDGEKEKYKTGKISREKMEEVILLWKKDFLKEYYSHIMSKNSESKEFMEDFLSLFPEEVTK